ncbi:unnamed protein product [Cuscuta epithymum]|uniref:BED-type domain-containing protein n=1 Tax=Cuscuta epithymum TaxID=186058 RepID=A0AAV0EEH9_9ASTE|nr:unnamed protein product [Cuscuta epithymum]
MADPETYDPSKDPSRKPKSDDPGWEFGFWPDKNNRDLVECALCGRQVHSGVKRLKQHLVGGYGDVEKCAKTTAEIRTKIGNYMKSKMKNKMPVPVELDDEDDELDEDHVTQVSSRASSIHPVPSSGTAIKRKRVAQATLKFQHSLPKSGKPTNSVASMIRKSPEEVIEERHSQGKSQQTLEGCTRSKEEVKKVHGHIADFFYENGIPFNAANSRSYEIMIESIGQFGPGLKPPSYHELRVPLLEEAVKDTEKLKENHEIAWKQYGCTLMSDGWSDKRSRHLVNFLVNSPEGTFFLESIDASHESQDASLLASLLEKQIQKIGKENVIQVVTDNGANYKAAGKLLEQRIPTLSWTPCSAHCLDLMMEDIGKLVEFKPWIDSARRCTTFIYRHTRILSAMRERTGGRDLVRAGVTRFATAFLTLQSLCKYREPLRNLFVSQDWNNSKLSSTAVGQRVCDTILATKFWNGVEDTLRACHPLLVVLRIVDGDEHPAMPELAMAMREAKKKINESFAGRPRVLKKLMKIFEDRWADQMEVKLYGAALFLNPSKYFDLKRTDTAYAYEQRALFNDVVYKMIGDDELECKISKQVDDYDFLRGGFAKPLPIKHQKTKAPLDWWNAFGGHALELQSLALRIIGLCCSSSGCERNWSTFEFIHTKKRNRLEHKRLNDLVFIQYNRKIVNRFKKRREEGSSFNPLVLEEFSWDNEWVDDSGSQVVHHGDDLLWDEVDEALGASRNLDRRNPRRGDGGEPSSSVRVYSRRRNDDTDVEENGQESEPFPNDDLDVDDEDQDAMDIIHNNQADSRFDDFLDDV